MRSRMPMGYVVEVGTGSITLNLLDHHKGAVAAFSSGVASVTDLGDLIGIDGGLQVVVGKVSGLRFAEPREAHTRGVGSTDLATQPLRNIELQTVGVLERIGGEMRFRRSGGITPALGAEAFPLSTEEHRAAIGEAGNREGEIRLGNEIKTGLTIASPLEKLLARHVAVVGSTGQGKSSFTAAVLQHIAEFPASHVVVFDINGEYEDSLRSHFPEGGGLKITRIGGRDGDGYRIPYYALGREGLARLLLPSERTQRPALRFAVSNLRFVEWSNEADAASLAFESRYVLRDGCQGEDAEEALEAIMKLRGGTADDAAVWPHMLALSALVAESHALVMGNRGPERSGFHYSNVAPLVNRVRRLSEDPMFKRVVSVEQGTPVGESLDMRQESAKVVEDIFGPSSNDWRIHVVDLREVATDLMPLVLGSLLELYAQVLFEKGQGNVTPSMLVLEEAHHYMRPVAGGSDEGQSELAYERLAKEGRKFGISLWLSTQRPSEISPTVLAQCDTWVCFRLTSERDLQALSAASEWMDRREVSRVSGLGQREALIFGGGVSMATHMRTLDADPPPRSSDPPFRQWLRSLDTAEENGGEVAG